jgi:hypothetical protein
LFQITGLRLQKRLSPGGFIQVGWARAAKTQSSASSIPKLEGIGMQKLRSFKVEAF